MKLYSLASEGSFRFAVLTIPVAIAMCLTAPIRAQVAGATLSGVVRDASGAVVTKATVTIKNTATGELRSVITNSGGLYSTPNLLPGPYQVEVNAPGFRVVRQKGLTLTVGAQQSLDFTLQVGTIAQTVVVTDLPPSLESSSATISSTIDSGTVRELPLNGRDWTSLATLSPGVTSIPNQATTGFSANKGNRGFGNQLSNGGHRSNENNYRVNGMSTNDYSNAAPGGATGVNLGVDAIDQFSVLTSNYTADYGRTSGASINAITKSGTNVFHGTAYVFDRDSIFDARNYFDGQKIPSFRRAQFGASGGAPIRKDHAFIFSDYEGIRQSVSNSGTVRVPNAGARAAAVPAIRPYLALWPVAPTGSPDTNPGGIGVQTFNVNFPTTANENYVLARYDETFSGKDSLDATYFFDSGPQQQADPLGNTVHSVFSRRQLITAEETHTFGASLVNTIRGGVSHITGLINDPVSGDRVATDPALAIAPGASAPPQIPVSGLTTAYGLGGFNRFNHDWTSTQIYDDSFLTRGTHAMQFGFAFENLHYNVLEVLSPNGRLNSYPSLSAFLNNSANQLNAVAPGGSHQVAFRQNILAFYAEDDWRVAPNFTLNYGLRYEIATKPADANNVPGYTVNGYTVATAGFQQIQTLSNCTPGTTACGPVGTSSPINSNPTVWNFEPRIGLAWNIFGKGKTVLHTGIGIFDVLPLPYVFGLNTAATAPFQIIGFDRGATLGTGQADQNLSFDRQSIRNRYIQPNPKRADVFNWNFYVQRDLGAGFTLMVGYVGSRSLHLSAAADDINLVQPTAVAGAGFVFPCDPSQLSAGGTCADAQTGTRIDSNWGGGAGIRPVLFDGASSYNGFQSQIQKIIGHGVQGQFAYTYSHCDDLSSAPVTGDTYLNSIAVPFLLIKKARLGACDFDIRQVGSGNLIWDLPEASSAKGALGLVANGWELGSIVSLQSGAPFTVTTGDGNDPLGTGYNGDFSMDFASLLPGCNPIHGGLNYLNTNCFTPPTAPASLAPASAANPYGCAPNSYTNFAGSFPSGQQPCSNVLGNTHRNQFYGPDLKTVDMSVFKNNKIPRISEKFNLQIRAEFFNILNHTNFLSPGFLNTFGQNNSVYDFDGSSLPTALNQTSTTSRQIQLGAKVIW